MHGRSILLISVVLMLCSGDSASADLVVHGKLDEGSRGIAVDSKGFLKVCEVCEGILETIENL